MGVSIQGSDDAAGVAPGSWSVGLEGLTMGWSATGAATKGSAGAEAPAPGVLRALRDVHHGVKRQPYDSLLGAPLRTLVRGLCDAVGAGQPHCRASYPRHRRAASGLPCLFSFDFDS